MDKLNVDSFYLITGVASNLIADTYKKYEGRVMRSYNRFEQTSFTMISWLDKQGSSVVGFTPVDAATDSEVATAIRNSLSEDNGTIQVLCFPRCFSPTTKFGDFKKGEHVAIIASMQFPHEYDSSKVASVEIEYGVIRSVSETHARIELDDIKGQIETINSPTEMVHRLKLIPYISM